MRLTPTPVLLFLVPAPALALALALVLPSCRSKADKAKPGPNEPPAAAVRGLFAAFAAKDCRRVEARIGGAFEKRYRKKGGCARLLAKDPLAKAKFVRVVSTVTDGRSKWRHTITFVIHMKKREMQIAAQVQFLKGKYRIVDL